MTDPCDNCNKHYCYGCAAIADEAAQREHQEQLVKAAHRASELVHWLSYQPEMSDSDKCELERMSWRLSNLCDRIE